MFGYASQHLRPDFISIMKSKNKIRITCTGKRLMRTGLPFDLPAKPKQALGFD